MKRLLLGILTILIAISIITIISVVYYYLAEITLSLFQ